MKKLLLLICLVQISALFGQKFAGGEIYYEQLGNKKYKVTAQVYRVCSDSSLNSLNGFVISDSFKTSMNFKRVSIARINDTCGNPCNIQNQSSNPGFEKHVFIDTVDFNKAPFNKYVKAGNCFVNFAIQQYKRDSSSNIKSSGNNLFYIESKVNICFNVTKNKSPEFAFEPKFYTCCNMPFIYNMGIIDSSDIDSLALELAPVLSDYATPVQYNGSFNSQIPMTPYCPPSPGVINCRALPNAKPPRGFYFDKETGDINFTPTNCYETGIIKVMVSEYRKDSTNKFILLGQVSREMQVKIQTCTNNNPPYFTGASRYSVCENNQICFNIGTKDDPFLPYQTTYDTVKVDWNHGISGASCIVKDSTAREKEMQFCWKTPSSNSSTYNRFGVVAYDKQCNIGMSSKGYIITKKPSAKTARTFKIDKCNQLKYQIQPIDSINTPLKNHSYSVTIVAFDNPTKTLFTSYKNNDSFKAPYSGKFIIKTQTNNLNFNCPVNTIDTVTLEAARIQLHSDSVLLVCHNDSVHLSPLHNSFSHYQYQWYDSEKGTKISDTTKSYHFKQTSPIRKVSIKVRDNKQCLYQDSIRVISRAYFTLIPNDKNITLCQSISDTIRVSTVKGQAPFYYEWYIDSVLSWADNFLPLNLTKSAHIRLKVVDQSTCYYEDTMRINIIQIPKIDLRDTSLCMNDTLSIQSRLIPALKNMSYRWTLDQTLSDQKTDGFNIRIKGKHTLKLEVSTNGGCQTDTTMQIDYYDLPLFTILGDTIFNKAHYIQLSSDKAFVRYRWSNGSTTKDNGFWGYTLGTPGKYNIRLEVTDSNGCKSEAVHYFRTNGLTDVESIDGKTFSILPNPFIRDIDIVAIENGDFKIFAHDGRLVKSGILNKGTTRISLEELAAGTYVIECFNQRSTIIKIE